MTSYYVELGQAGIEDLSTLFIAEPFSVSENIVEGYHQGYRVLYNSARESRPFMDYGREEMTLFYAAIESFPKAVQEDIRARLTHLNQVELGSVISEFDLVMEKLHSKPSQPL